jgi:hypothetical protein
MAEKDGAERYGLSIVASKIEKALRPPADFPDVSLGVASRIDPA